MSFGQLFFRQRYVMRGAIWGGLLLAAIVLSLSTGTALATSYQPLVGIVHVHSSYSTGLFSLEEIALRAEELGIDVVVLADNYHLNFTYSPPLLRGLFQVSKAFPSLTNSTIVGYLKDVEDTNRRHPKVIMVPGVETVPHYFWTGSLRRGKLTMYDGQKNILVVGLNQLQDYQSLPIIGNPEVARYDASSMFRAAPIVLVLAGLGLLVLAMGDLKLNFRSRAKDEASSPKVRTRQVRQVGRQDRYPTLAKREHRYRVGGTRRRMLWFFAAPLLVIGGVWTVYNSPFTGPIYPPYGPDAGYTPHQALLDYVDRLGGATLWSYPEARDFHTKNLPLVGQIFIITNPYPEALLATVRYTGFGAIYQDNTTVDRPGQMWDEALNKYCMGQRDRPFWGVGELGFHGTIKGKYLNSILTTFFVRKRTAKEVLNALKSGRMYASYPAGSGFIRLVVRTFALTNNGREATLGETLAVPPGESVTLSLALETNDGMPRPFEATLVRNGEPWKDLKGTTPFTLSDTPPSDRQCTYYRLWMNKPHRLTTNPVFATHSSEVKDYEK